MASIIWTTNALAEVDAIARFIGADVSPAARVFAQSIFVAVERLEVFPNSGRVVPEIGSDEIREVIVGSYRVIHLVLDDRVMILAVRHSARRFP